MYVHHTTPCRFLLAAPSLAEIVCRRGPHVGAPEDLNIAGGAIAGSIEWGEAPASAATLDVGALGREFRAAHEKRSSALDAPSGRGRADVEAYAPGGRKDAAIISDPAGEVSFGAVYRMSTAAAWTDGRTTSAPPPIKLAFQADAIANRDQFICRRRCSHSPPRARLAFWAHYPP